MSRTRTQVIETEFLDAAIVRVEGALDDSFALARRQRRVVVFDLGAVRSVTSRGVRRWMKMLDDLSAPYYCFTNCRAAVVDQFNLVEGFGKHGELVSLFAPYRCGRCATAFEYLVRTDHDALDVLGAPSADCPHCGEPAEFDDDPSVYFQYVRSKPRPRPPAAARAAIDGRTGESPRRRFSLRKEIHGAVTAFRLSGHLDRDSHFRRAADGVEERAVLDLSDMDGASARGLAGLASFLQALGNGASLARVPYQMLGQLAAIVARPECAGADLVSLRVPFVCPACPGRRWIDLNLAQLEALGSGTQPAGAAHRCPDCHRTLQCALTANETAELSAAPLAPPPPAVERYLRKWSRRRRVSELHSPPADDGNEATLLGKYRVVQALGQGRLGDVFLARQVGPEDFEKLVVLKRIRSDRLKSRKSRDLFVREARLAARLSHPNIVQIYDLERLGDEYVMALEYVNGIDLRRALDLSREAGIIWPVPLCCRIMAELCAALSAAHACVDEAGDPAPVIHANVTASNVLLAADGTVKLSDFGMARVLGDLPGAATPAVAARGSSPTELNRFRADSDPRNDIYAVAVVMFESLTLRPFNAARPGSLPGDAGRALPPPPQLFVWRSGLSPLVQAVFEKAMQPDPDRRYRSARHFELDLLRILKTSPASGRDDLAMWVKRILALSVENEGLAVRSRGSLLEIVADEGQLRARGAWPPGSQTPKAPR